VTVSLGLATGVRHVADRALRERGGSHGA